MAIAPKRAPHSARDGGDHSKGVDVLPPMRMPSLNPLLVHVRLPPVTETHSTPQPTRASTLQRPRVEEEGEQSNQVDNGERTSDWSSNSSEGGGGGSARGTKRLLEAEDAPRARKPFYLVQKKAKEELQYEIHALEVKADQLRERLGGTTQQMTRVLAEKQHHTQQLQEMLSTQNRFLWSMQSMMAAHSSASSRVWNPLTTYIHLPADMSERRKCLRSLHEAKVQRNLQYLQERLRFIDEKRPYESIEKCVNADGEYTQRSAQIVHFHGAQSVKQVLEALKLSLYYFDMSLTDTFGHVTLRDDIDVVEDAGPMKTRISNQRYVSTYPQDIQQEMNVVSFSEYYPSRAESDTEGVAVSVLDFVDNDQLHPYSANRLRRDISAVLEVRSFRRPQDVPTVYHPHEHHHSDERGQLVVVVRRCAYITIRCPQFEVPYEVMEVIREKSVAWGSTLDRSVQEILDSARSQ